MIQRKHFEWKLKSRSFLLGERTLILGAINVAPDSTAGGKFQDVDRAFAQAILLEEQGADIIDIGAESTKPTVARISEAEELRRLAPILKRLRGALRIPISVDTWKAGVADKALELGAEIINDPSGLTWDPQLVKSVVKHDAGFVLAHMRGTPETWAKLPPVKDMMNTVGADLDAAFHRALRGGVSRKAVVLDPGIGFGKRREQNVELLARLGSLQSLDAPVLVGASHKAFVAKTDSSQAESLSAAAAAAAVLRGAHLVRVHDVRLAKPAVELADSLLQVRQEEEPERGPAPVRPALRPARRPAPYRS